MTTIPLKGYNNGTFGFGMTGILFPTSMNGPFGYQNKPIPIDQEFPVLINGPKYNMKEDNLPAYAIKGSNKNEMRLFQKPIMNSDPFGGFGSFI